MSFGPDIVESFLLQNQLKFVIRSHECVRSGYEEPYTVRSSENRIGGAMLCTIFSASDYGGSGNSAAYLEFSVVPEEELPLESPTSFKTRRSTMSMSRQFSVSELAGSPVDNMSELKRVHGTNMQYTVHYFYATPLHFGAEGELGLDNGHRDTTLDLSGLVRDVHGEDGVRIDAALSHSSSRTMDGYRMPGANDILIGSSISVEELICLRKQLLLEAFERGDRVMAGHVSQQYWLRVMTDVLNVSISWRRLARFLIKEEMTSTEGESRGGPDNSNSEIKYIDFLNSFEDDIIFGRSPDDRDSIVSPPVGSAAAGASESESVGVEDVQLIAASADTSVLSLVHPDKAVDEVSQRSSPVATSSSPYFGHLISSDVISALYSNHEKVEEAFRFFDTNGDNCFDLDDLLAGCATLNLLEPQDSSADNSAQGSTATPMPSSSSSLYRVDDIVQLMQIMDVFQCGAIDINIFFEMFRLSLLSTSMMDDSHWTKPLLTRELSHAHELYRLSHFVLPSTPIYPSGSAHSHAHGIHASQLSAMGSLELRKGVEIGVDSELISSRNSEVGEQVGLSIDI